MDEERVDIKRIEELQEINELELLSRVTQKALSDPPQCGNCDSYYAPVSVHFVYDEDKRVSGIHICWECAGCDNAINCGC